MLVTSLRECSRACGGLAVILCAALLAGCATQPAEIEPDLPWDQRRARLDSLENWKIHGKLALRTPEMAESATLIWIQQGDVSFVDLTGPLGVAATRLRSDGDSLEIEQEDETSVYDISSPESVAASTGWNLPLKSLPTWVLGIPYAHAEAEGLEIENDLVQEFTEDGWHIRYERYGQFGLYTLPTRMTVEREGTRALIMMYDWTVSQHR